MKVYGNRPAIQPKISVGAPGDKYEQEADQMAQQVMSMPAAVSHPPINGWNSKNKKRKSRYKPSPWQLPSPHSCNGRGQRQNWKKRKNRCK
jgi:hypothetical protein